MARTKIIALTYLAMLAASALVAAPASAEEGKGELVNSKGEALVKNHFTAEGGETVFESVGGARITCKKSKKTGVVTSKTGGEATLTLTGCESTEVKCSTKGSEGGEIQSAITWRIDRSKIDDLLRNSFLSAVAITCGTTKISAIGDWEIPVEPMKTLKKVYTFTAKETKGVQEPATGSEFEKLTFAIGEKGKEQTGVKGTEEISYEEEVEFI